MGVVGVFRVFFCSCVGFIPIGLSLCFKGFFGGCFCKLLPGVDVLFGGDFRQF